MAQRGRIVHNAESRAATPTLGFRLAQPKANGLRCSGRGQELAWRRKGLGVAFLAGVPPWLALSFLLGVGSGSLFHLLFSAELGRLPVYLLVSSAAALIGGAVGAQLGPSPWTIGEAHLLAIFGAAWSALAITRLLEL